MLHTLRPQITCDVHFTMKLSLGIRLGSLCPISSTCRVMWTTKSTPNYSALGRKGNTLWKWFSRAKDFGWSSSRYSILCIKLMTMALAKEMRHTDNHTNTLHEPTMVIFGPSCRHGVLWPVFMWDWWTRERANSQSCLQVNVPPSTSFNLLPLCLKYNKWPNEMYKAIFTAHST